MIPAKIQIGDHVLSEAQAEIVRIAVSQLLTEVRLLRPLLGNDLADSYAHRGQEIVLIIAQEATKA